MRDVGQAQAASGEIDVGRRLASVIVEFGFDDEGRMTSRTLPLGQRESMEFDANGNLVRKVTFNGEVLEYGYDDSDRMVLKRVPGHADVLITYTPSGQRAAVVDERGVTRYAYDVRDRTARVEHPEGTWIECAWDAAGNRTRVETPNGWTSYEYDEAGRLTRAIDSAAGVFEYAFDPAGNELELRAPNGVVTARTYDALNRLRSIEAIGPAGVVTSHHYTHDATGRRVAVAEHDGRSVVWTYDRLYRLVREEIVDPLAGDEDIRFVYDAVGNRLSRTDLAHGLVLSTYDANDRLLTVGAETRSYDDAGNTLTAGGTAYTWDAEHRLLAAVTASAALAFAYDVDGIRVRKSVDGAERVFLVDHELPYAEVLEERVLGTLDARYTQARDLLARQGPEGVRVYHQDGITSLRALTDESGTKSDELRYEAFGTPTIEPGDSPSRYRFAGEVRDEETGLQYHRARYYETATGRFLGMDPALSNHAFGYAGQRPVDEIDPSGLDSLGVEVGAMLAASFDNEVFAWRFGVRSTTFTNTNELASLFGTSSIVQWALGRLSAQLSDDTSQVAFGRGPRLKSGVSVENWRATVGLFYGLMASRLRNEVRLESADCASSASTADDFAYVDSRNPRVINICPIFFKPDADPEVIYRKRPSREWILVHELAHTALERDDAVAGYCSGRGGKCYGEHDSRALARRDPSAAFLNPDNYALAGYLEGYYTAR